MGNCFSFLHEKTLLVLNSKGEINNSTNNIDYEI